MRLLKSDIPLNESDAIEPCPFEDAVEWVGERTSQPVNQKHYRCLWKVINHTSPHGLADALRQRRMPLDADHLWDGSA